KFFQRFNLGSVFLPLWGIALCLLAWHFVAGKTVTKQAKDDFGDVVTVTKRVGLSADLPTPVETWKACSSYILKPFAKRGELDQGILAFTWLSLKLVAQGYAIALLLGTPLGFCLGLSKTFTKMFDPIFQVLRPVSPLAWLPLGMVLFLSAKVQLPGGAAYTASALAAIFPPACC